MTAAKWIAALGLLASGSVGAQEAVYDYRGAVMTGLGGPETLTAQLAFFGPVAYPGTVVDISMSFSGTVSGLYFSTSCPIADCETPGVPLQLQINQTHGSFVSADLNFAHIFQDGNVFYDGSFIIGPIGDSLTLAPIFGPNIVSVSNSKPGAWAEIGAGAPELNPSAALSALTLLGGALLIRTGRRRARQSR